MEFGLCLFPEFCYTGFIMQINNMAEVLDDEFIIHLIKLPDELVEVLRISIPEIIDKPLPVIIGFKLVCRAVFQLRLNMIFQAPGRYRFSGN